MTFRSDNQFWTWVGWESALNLQRLLMSLLTKCLAAGEKDTAEARVTGGVLNICVASSSLDGKEGWLAKAELR